MYRLKKPDAAGKLRRVVIVSNDRMSRGNLEVLAVPFYSSGAEKKAFQPWCAPFYMNEGDGALTTNCYAKCDLLSLIPKTEIDLRNKLGELNAEQMSRIEESLRHVLGMTHGPPLK